MRENETSDSLPDVNDDLSTPSSSKKNVPKITLSSLPRSTFKPKITLSPSTSKADNSNLQTIQSNFEQRRGKKSNDNNHVKNEEFEKQVSHSPTNSYFLRKRKINVETCDHAACINQQKVNNKKRIKKAKKSYYFKYLVQEPTEEVSIYNGRLFKSWREQKKSTEEANRFWIERCFIMAFINGLYNDRIKSKMIKWYEENPNSSNCKYKLTHMINVVFKAHDYEKEENEKIITQLKKNEKLSSN